MGRKLYVRGLSFLIVLSLVFSTLVGCGKSEDVTADSTVSEKRNADETTINDNFISLDEDRKQAEEEEKQKVEEERIKAEEEKQRAEEERVKAEEEEKQKVEEERIKAEEEKQRIEEERIKTEEEEKQKAEEERIKAEEEAKRLAEEEKQKAEEERLKAEEEAKKQAEEERIQKNSFSMMYYLAITAEEIRTSKDNRLALDDIYTSLLNDINPGAIDEITQDHLRNLRDIIKSYINISTKRERLQFVYNQNKASAIRSAVPSPVAILSLAKSTNWVQLAINVGYTAVSSISNYNSASDAADMEFLMSGWELDDEELATIQKNRDRAFDYMVDMVQEYKLDGLKTLNEKSVEKFVEISAIESANERIKRLESEEETYELLGNYWLELADSYFEIGQYKKCLECVDKYNDLSMEIYRKDFNLAKILPKAIVSVQNVYSGDTYVNKIDILTASLIENTSTEDWSVRYFAAEVYLDLYAKTKKYDYLKKAYDIAYDNVSVLLNEQRSINKIYVNEVQEMVVEEPDYRYMSEEEQEQKEKEYKEEKKRAKEYNKEIKKKRETEVPSLYEPLVLNCELLFSLAELVNPSKTEKDNIDAILKDIFLVKPLNIFYSFAESNVSYDINISEDEIEIPAYLLSEGSEIVITIKDGSNTSVINDAIIDEVEREGNDINTFYAVVESEQMEDYEWHENVKISVDIIYHDAYDRKISFNYYVSTYVKGWWGPIKVGREVIFSKE